MNWQPLPGVTRSLLPIVRPSRWTWLDTLLVVPMGLALIVGLVVVEVVGWQQKPEGSRDV